MYDTPQDTPEDITWLDRNYGGAPDECSPCFVNGKIVKIEDCSEHR